MDFFRVSLIFAVITNLKCEENICESIDRSWDFISNSTFLTCKVINLCCGDFYSENITAINFPRNVKISQLPNGIYLNFPNLQILDASKNSIEVIKEENFVKLIKLEAIDLSYNKIRKIPKTTFKYSPALRIIHLSKFIIFFVCTSILILIYFR